MHLRNSNSNNNNNNDNNDNNNNNNNNNNNKRYLSDFNVTIFKRDCFKFLGLYLFEAL